jgi:hypothetical protein
LDLGVKIRKVLGVICKIYKIHKNKTRLQGYSGGHVQKLLLLPLDLEQSMDRGRWRWGVAAPATWSGYGLK